MRRVPHSSEWHEQVAVFQWRDYAKGQYPELDMLFHCPNGGFRTKAEAGKFAAAGVKRGVPDIFLDVARGHFHGLRIELKAHGGKISPMQVTWNERLRDEGYSAHICWGAEDAIKTIEAYLRLDNGR